MEPLYKIGVFLGTIAFFCLIQEMFTGETNRQLIST